MIVWLVGVYRIERMVCIADIICNQRIAKNEMEGRKKNSENNEIINQPCVQRKGMDCIAIDERIKKTRRKTQHKHRSKLSARFNNNCCMHTIHTHTHTNRWMWLEMFLLHDLECTLSSQVCILWSRNGLIPYAHINYTLLRYVNDGNVQNIKYSKECHFQDHDSANDAIDTIITN